MNERIKQIRTESGLNQTDFAKRISVSRSAVCKMESGENSPSEQTIKLICREFSVNENWLRNGVGEMFLKRTKDDEISEMLGKIQRDNENHFKKRFVTALSKLDDKDWDSLEKLVDEIVNQKKEGH